MYRNDNCAMYFVDALLGVRDNAAVVSFLVLDSLYMWRTSGSSFSFLDEILSTHEQKLSTEKLEGILDALSEFQIASEIPEFILDRILALLTARLSGGEPDDIGWIRRAFFLLERSFSVKRLEQLINLGIDHFPIPEAHINSFLSCVKSIISKASTYDFHFKGFASYQIKRVQYMDESFTKSNTPRSYLASIIKSLTDAVSPCEAKSEDVKLRNGITR